MFLSNLLKLGLHKSSCILFSCLFFVSCNTASSKPTEVVSTAGSRKIASASAAAAAMAVNSSAFLMMQACPVLASIQSRIPSWRGTADRDEHINRYNAAYVMNMLQETDGQGRTLHQRLMLELSSDSDCLKRIGDLRETICFYREYSQACEALYQLDKLKGETIIQEFEQFAGASIDSIDPSQLAGKIDEFINNSSGFFKKTFRTLRESVDKEGIVAVGALVSGAIALVRATATLGSNGLVSKTAAVGLGGLVVAGFGVTGVAGITAVALTVGASMFLYSSNYEKKIKNRVRRPENP